MALFPILLIAIGVAVLLLGQRLAVLGAAVGAILGLALLSLFDMSANIWLQLLIVGGLAVAGFFVAAFAKGIIDIVILVIGVVAGAAVVIAFLDLFNVDLGLVNLLLAAVGGLAGFILIRRFRKGPIDWGMVILAGLVGGLLVTWGVTRLIPALDGTVWSSLLLVVLVGAGIAYQGKLIGPRQSPPAQPSAGSGQPPAQ